MKNGPAKRAYMVQWRKEHPDYNKTMSRLYYTKYGDRYRAYGRKNNLKTKYGITPEQYDEMLANQNGVCAICNKPPCKYRLSVDHNHVTEQVRKLLCLSCNARLWVLENKEFRSKAEAYLNSFEDRDG